MKTIRVRRWLAVAILAGMLTASFAIAQKDDQAELLMQAAHQKQLVEGQLEEAIQLYKRVVQEHAGNRTLAAKALLEMGQCYEKLGNAEARKAYEHVLRDYADQNEAAAQARARLAALSSNVASKNSEMVTRRVWTGRLVLAGLSPDGRYLSCVEETGDLALLDFATGKTRRLTNNASGAEEVEFSAISPDGKEVAYTWKQEEKGGTFLTGMSLVRLDGSAPRVLYNRENLFGAPTDWSLDGKYILTALVKPDWTFQIARVAVADGSVHVLKTLDGGTPGNMKFSPDGRYIVYDFSQQQDSDSRDIFLLAADGSREIRLVEHPADDHLLGWTPDGNHILFASDRSGSTSAWAIRVADGKPQGSPVLVKPNIGQVLPIGFSRSGSFYYGLVIGTIDIYTAEFDPATGRVLTQPENATQRFVGSNSSPAWSLDGEYLAYISERNLQELLSAEQVVSIRSLTTGQEHELSPRFYHIFPNIRWSPDGRSILVQAMERKRLGQEGVYRIDAQTGEVTRLLQTENGSELPNPAWFPDGKRLLYKNTKPGTESENILMRDLETGRETALYQADSAEIGDIALSPDGRQVALTLFDKQTRSTGLKVLSVAAGEARELLTVKEPETIPEDSLTWTSDSRYVVFGRVHHIAQDMKTELVAVPAGGGEAHALGVAMDGVRNISFRSDGRRVAFTAGQPLFPPKTEVWVMENFLPTLKAARLR
jgi:Tol biopolymer transport system component